MNNSNMCNLLSSPNSLQYISNTNIYFANLHIFQKLVIPPTLCPKGTRKPSKLHSSPKCWHGISNTKIFIQLIHNPKMYIPPTLCPKGTRKPPKLHSSPKCWHVISNTKISIQLIHNPKMYIPPTLVPEVHNVTL